MIDELRTLKNEGASIQEFGTRLYIWHRGQAFATRHLTDAEYEQVKQSGLIDGVRDSRGRDPVEGEYLTKLRQQAEVELKLLEEFAKDHGEVPKRVWTPPNKILKRVLE